MPSWRSRAARLGVPGALGAAAVALLRPPGRLVALAGRACPGILFSVRTPEPLVALSLDDGPHPDVTPRILDVLGAHGAQATFFVIGSRAARHPALLERVLAEGHELGNHGWEDERAWKLPEAGLRESLARTAAVLPQGAAPALFRPGGGWPTPSVLRAGAACGYRCALGGVYPLDGTLQLPRYARWDVVRRARPGAILVLHEGTSERARVVGVLDGVLGDLAARGLRVTAVSRLLRAAHEGS